MRSDCHFSGRHTSALAWRRRQATKLARYSTGAGSQPSASRKQTDYPVRRLTDPRSSRIESRDPVARTHLATSGLNRPDARAQILPARSHWARIPPPALPLVFGSGQWHDNKRSGRAKIAQWLKNTLLAPLSAPNRDRPMIVRTK